MVVCYQYWFIYEMVEMPDRHLFLHGKTVDGTIQIYHTHGIPKSGMAGIAVAGWKIKQKP